jgi:hypothetical protein
MSAPHPSKTMCRRNEALERLYLEVARELWIGVIDKVIDAASRYRAVDEAERRYAAWVLAFQSGKPPVMRTRVDIAMSNLFSIDYHEPF